MEQPSIEDEEIGLEVQPPGNNDDQASHNARVYPCLVDLAHTQSGDHPSQTPLSLHITTLKHTAEHALVGHCIARS